MSTKLGMLTGEHIHMDDPHGRSVEQVDVNGGTDGIVAGTVLGMITATSVYVRHDPAASDGSETVKGVLFEGVTETDRRTIHVRACQVVKEHLTYADGATPAQITATDTALVALGVIPR